MHVPIENIMPVNDFADKVNKLTEELNDEDMYVTTQNDRPTGVYMSVAHLTRLIKDSEGIVADSEAAKPSLPPLPPKPTSSLPNWDEKELEAPHTPSLSPLPTFGSVSKPPLPPITEIMTDTLKPASPVPPPLPPLPEAPKLDDKTPLVTESEVKSAVTGSDPFAPASDTPKPPLPPVNSPFGNVSSSTINPAPASPPSGISSPPTWPTTPKPMSDTKIDSTSDDEDDDTII